MSPELRAALAAATCPTCGRPLEQKGTGRPRARHDNCRKLDQLIGWTEDLVLGIDFDPDHGRRMRSRLWHLANGINKVPHRAKS